MSVAVCPTASSVLTIDLAALRRNWRALAERASPAECAAVVKADAYGVGAAEVAPALYAEGCRTFFVAQLCEAIALQPVLPQDALIAILNGLDPGCEALCFAHGFLPVLNSRTQIARWRALARAKGRALPAILQLDSGMSRLGLSPVEAQALSEDARFGEDVALRLIMTHLACADHPQAPANAAQLASFAAVAAGFGAIPLSIANSAAVYLPEGFRHDLVRPGYGLFGDAPAPGAEGLAPVIGLEARVVQIREVSAGAGVGYGHDYVADGPLRLATLGIGYADGWPRSLGNHGSAFFKGVRLPFAGRVSMDSLTVDISALPDGDLAEGDLVELIGPSQTLAQVAHDAGTIGYEILTRLGRRHQRIYLGAEAAQPEIAQ